MFVRKNDFFNYFFINSRATAGAVARGMRGCVPPSRRVGINSEVHEGYGGVFAQSYVSRNLGFESVLLPSGNLHRGCIIFDIIFNNFNKYIVMRYIDKNQLSLFPEEQENNQLTSEKISEKNQLTSEKISDKNESERDNDIATKRNNLFYSCLSAFLEYEASNYFKFEVYQAIRDVPDNRKDDNEIIDEIFEDWKYRFSFSEYDILEAIPYLPNKVLRDIGEELEENISEFEDYLQAGYEYFDEEFFEDEEDI